MDVLTLIIQLASGALGGNLAGSAMKNLSLGGKGNTLAGLLGGLLGGQVFERSLEFGQIASDAGLDVGTLVSQIAGGGVGGGVLMAIVGILRRLFAR